MVDFFLCHFHPKQSLWTDLSLLKLLNIFLIKLILKNFYKDVPGQHHSGRMGQFHHAYGGYQILAAVLYLEVVT